MKATFDIEEQDAEGGESRAFRERLQEQDPEALATFFDTYFDYVFGRVQSHVGSYQLAEDLTQDVFLKIHRALPGFDPSKRLRPWVSAIARNRVYDHWRSWRRGEDLEMLEPGAAGEAAHPSTIDSGDSGALSEQSERDFAVREAVESLPEGMRSVMHLRMYDELPFESIARSLSLTTTTARKRYSRALSSLRHTLALDQVYA